MKLSIFIIIFYALVFPTALFCKTSLLKKRKDGVTDTTITLFAGISLGYSPMKDAKYNQWLEVNNHSEPNPYYLDFKCNLAGQKNDKYMVGLDFDFYGTGNTTNYPLRLNLGIMFAKYYKHKWANAILSASGGYNFTWVNSFKDPAPPQFANLGTPNSVQLTKKAFYISPAIKLLWKVSKKSGFCTGLDIGARIYPLESKWSFSNEDNQGLINTSAQSTSGIPNPTRLDFYVNILIGTIGHP